MLRKLEREGYTTGPLDYNAHLDDLHAVNVSKPVRSGGPMTEAYLQPLKPIGAAADALPAPPLGLRRRVPRRAARSATAGSCWSTSSP